MNYRQFKLLLEFTTPSLPAMSGNIDEHENLKIFSAVKYPQKYFGPSFGRDLIGWAPVVVN